MAEQEKKGLDLEQQRAAHAWKCTVGCEEKYANLAKSAPALIMNNGLMQTLAFYKSKGKGKGVEEAHNKLLEDVCLWLGQRDFALKADSPFKGVMTFLHGSESAIYRRATEEALALLRWIRQFASALVKKV